MNVAMPTSTPSSDPVRAARDLLAECHQNSDAQRCAATAQEIAALWSGVDVGARMELAAVYASALAHVTSTLSTPERAQSVAGQIGGLLAVDELRTGEIGEAFARALVNASAASKDAWQRYQYAAQIEDLLDEGPPFDRPSIAMAFGRAVHCAALLDAKSPEALAVLARLERIVAGKHASGPRLVTVELGYEAAKVILLVALAHGVELIEGRKDDVRRLVRATNSNPGEDLDNWLSNFAAGEHIHSDFAIELLGDYRELRVAALGESTERFGF